jgi:cation diffusion facilitator family transporter
MAEIQKLSTEKKPDGHNHPPTAHEHHEHNEDHQKKYYKEHGHAHAEKTKFEKPGHDHDKPHDHDHDEHDYNSNFFQRLFGGIVHTHSHDDEGGMARYAEESKRGIWALKISLLGLAATALFQVVIVIISGSAALLADTVHNFSDALTAVPLWIAFVIGRRQANRRYTYGYGRAEDLAGLFVVLMILLSAIIAINESFQKLINPQPITNIGWVVVAAIAGFIGNEAVAWFRIKIGKEIGSAALIADGQHARVDGLTSLAVLFGAVGVLLGFPQADPIVGLLISGAILLILKDTATTMYRRMMDAIEPDFVDKIEKSAAKVEGVEKVHTVRGRWLGHKLFAELSVEVNGNLSVRQGHDIGEEVRHQLWHEFPRLGDIILHVDPSLQPGEAEAHNLNSHHNLK